MNDNLTINRSEFKFDAPYIERDGKHVILGINNYEYSNYELVPNYDDLFSDDPMFFKVPIPDEPADLTAVANYSLPIEKQKWKVDSRFARFKVMTLAERREFMYDCWEWRMNGFWFFNKGNLTYITGDHWMFLSVWPIGSLTGRPEYRDRDRRFFLVWNFVEADDECTGLVYLKHRRDGATHRSNCIIVNRATTTRDATFGIVSKTGKDAEKVNWRFLLNGVNGLPKFFQPERDGQQRPKSDIKFQKRARKAHNAKDEDEDEALNTMVEWRDTTVNAFDGTQMRILHIDEPGKWSRVDIEEFLNIHTPCVKLGPKKIIGKLLLTSTNGEAEKEGGERFRGVYESSDPLNRNQNNRTPSGLYRYFVPADDGLEGFIDEWGYSMREEARDYLMNERKALIKQGKLQKLMAEKRIFPLTPNEALATSSNECQFNVVKLNNAMDIVHALPERMFRYCNLEWDEGVVDGIVKVRDTDSRNARFKIFKLPDRSIMNRSDAMEDLTRQEYLNRDVIDQNAAARRPANTMVFVAGCDPIDRGTNVNVGEGSKAAAHVYHRFDPSDENSGAFVCQYFARPDDPEVFYEDMVKMCVLYGCQILIESQRIGIINYFRKRGYASYLMMRPNYTRNSQSARNQVEYGIPASGEVNSFLHELMESWIERNLPFDEQSTSVWYPVLPFRELISQLVEYDPDYRTKFDLYVSACLALMGDYRPVDAAKRKSRGLKPENFMRLYRYENGRAIQIRKST